MNVTEEIIESTATELEPVATPATLFRTDDPTLVLKRAEEVANALAPVIRKAGLVSQISGKDYLTVEAWQTLGAQVGVTPVIVSTTRIEQGWEARCEARTLDGRVVGAADSMCLTSEERWEDSADFEVRSMAQTRAMSRALASVLRFIPTLAGFAGTPAEEMQGVRQQHGKTRPSDKQVAFIAQLAKGLGANEADQDLIRDYCKANLSAGKEGSASKTIELLKGDGDGVPAEVLVRLLESANEWNAKQSDLPADTTDLPAAA